MGFCDFDNVKLEKANAMKKYNQLQKIGNFFRIFEIFVALMLFSWFSSRLPIVVQISEKYFKNLCVIVVSPKFVFFLGNAIILTLFMKSGQFSGEESVGNSDGNHLYDEFVKKSQINHKNRTDTFMAKEEIIYEDKNTVYEEKTVTDTYTDTGIKMGTDTVTDTVNNKGPKVYRRSQSEIPKVEAEEKPKRELRRSNTEKCCRKCHTGSEKPVEEVAEVVAEEGLDSEGFISNEEFRRTIEEFIAKQVRFHRQESMSIVLQ